MEQRKIINRMTVRVMGTEYEINNPRGFTVHHGACQEGATPREVYERHFPPDEKDGLEYKQKTLFYISESLQGFTQVHARTAKLIPDEVGMTQEGYALIYMRPRTRVWANMTRWHDRPLIVMAEGRVDLPDSVLYDTSERDGTMIRKSRFLCHDIGQLDAVVKWLDANGLAWDYM